MKFTLRVELPGEGNKLGQFFVDGVEHFRRGRKEFAPMRAGLKWSEFFFDDGQELADRRPVLFPGEVNGDTGLLVARAHPQVIGGDGADFCD